MRILDLKPASSPPLAAMYRLHGKLVGERCEGCWNLERDAATDTFQCALYAIHAPGSAGRWLSEWLACGAWRENVSMPQSGHRL